MTLYDLITKLVDPKALLAFLLSALGLCAGCSLFDQHAKEFDTLNAMAHEVRSQLGAGGMGQYAVAAQGINPGIRLHAAIVYEAGANYDGLAGQFTASAQGQFNRPVSPEDADFIRRVAGAQYNDDAARSLAIQAAVKAVIDRLVTPKPPASQPEPPHLDALEVMGDPCCEVYATTECVVTFVPDPDAPVRPQGRQVVSR